MSTNTLASSELGARSARLRRRRLPVVLATSLRFIIGGLLCLTPMTAVLVLGWLMRFTRAVVLRRLAALPRGRTASGTTPAQMVPQNSIWPGWLMSSAGPNIAARLTGSLWQNLSVGLGALVSLSIATLPFSLLWQFSWWAGWENSFNKGYEQSWVGPTVALIGVLIAVNVLSYLPMALAHQAVKGNWRAFFAVPQVTALIRRAGWRYPALALAITAAALPLFAAKGLPVFIEKIRPGFADLPVDEAKIIADQIRLATAFYTFAALVFVRWLGARVYVFATQRKRNSWLATTILWTGFLWVIWFGLVAQIFVGQFLNHNWLYWLNHPFVLLPWTP